MKDKLIKNEYQKKIKLLNKYNRKYYDQNLSIISDIEYDELKKKDS